MSTKKIGKFIAEKRREKSYTQAQKSLTKCASVTMSSTTASKIRRQ